MEAMTYQLINFGIDSGWAEWDGYGHRFFHMHEWRLAELSAAGDVHMIDQGPATMGAVRVYPQPGRGNILASGVWADVKDLYREWIAARSEPAAMESFLRRFSECETV